MARRFDAERLFTEPDTRVLGRLTEATADFARRSSAGLTFTAAKISEAVALLKVTFPCRRAEALFNRVVTCVMVTRAGLGGLRSIAGAVTLKVAPSA